MNSYWKSILILIISFSTTIASAQEDCSNGTDDDGDGLIDCFDNDCSDNVACEDFFFGNPVLCADDIDVSTFAIRQQWGSEDESATSHVTPAIGDLDGNGIPEVVSVNNYGSLDLFVLNGATGATIASADIGFTPENAPIIAKIDGDEIGDIIVSQNKGDDLALYNVDIVTGILTERWRERASVNQSIGLPGVADFDEDGDVEIYYRNEVMDALTGTVIIAGDGNWEEDYTHGSIAVDVLPDAACADCAGLELVSGNEIWAINEAAGTRTLIEDMDDDIHDDIDPNLNYYPKYYPNWDDQWSTVSAADYNLDGNIDLIMTGALGTASEEYNGETTIFFWDVANQNVITYHDPTNNFVRGPGRVNIGDVDGDGQLNANFVMDQKLYSLDENFNIHWIHPIKEGSSGFTGCSLFDFDGDGAVEVVYRSEESLLIVDGVGNGDNTTNERNEIACVSRTQEEYPVIADVDGDGSSEICVSCYTNNSTPFSPYSNTQFSQIRIYESDGEAWMPARGVWNQHGYYNVNINDDLTIPTEVQDHSVIFSLANSCEYADGTTIPFDNRPLNTFLNQAPILNEEGCVEFASPDIRFEDIISASDALCPDAEITVQFEITNLGDIDISGSLPVSYYAGNPQTANATLLDTKVALLVNFEVGETLTLEQTFSGIGGDFMLYVVINDNGGTPPLDNPLPTATIPECETINNIDSTRVGFQTFDLTVEKIFDNRKCVDSYVDGGGNTVLVPDNGQARAYYFGPTPGGNETFWVENFEDRANGAQSDTDDTGWSSDPGTESPGAYGVTTYNGSKMFHGNNTGTSNDVGIVTWTSEDIDISGHTDVNVTMDIFENGNQEGSGQWRDFVRVTYEVRDRSNAVSATGQFSNGFQIDDFTYAQAFLSNLNTDGSDSILVITAEIHNTSSSEFHYIDNISINGTGPDITAEFTEPDGFEFFWYDAADATFSTILNNSSTFSQMPDGTYNVIGYFETTECYSDTVEVEILRTTPTVHVWAYEISPLTQCDTPDGSVGAFVYTQTEQGTFPANDTDNRPLDTLEVADGYEFNWRDNDDITNTVFATGNVIENLLAKEFAVDVIDLQTRCTNTALIEVTTNTEAVNAPNIAITHITACGGTGELSADIDGGTAGYTFDWYDGNGVKPAADFTGAVYTVTSDGEYTIVVTDDDTGCVSDPVTVTLNDNSIAPDPTLTLVQDNSSCVAGNGILSADGDGAGTVTGFTFEWFLGANTLAGNALPGTAAPGAFLVSDNPYELGGLEGGTYTVRVTDNSTSCFKVETIEVDDNPGSLTVTPGNLIVNDINSCDVAVLGSIDASGVVPTDVTTVSIGNINSSFEELDILTNNDHSQSFNGGRIKTYQQDFINGWSTTAGDQRIEIWHNNNTISGSIHDAFHGDQFAEINANQTAALYFDLATVPGSLLNWSFAHKGRAGTDEISVNIGEPGAEVVQGSFSTGNTAWAFYEGEYTIPTDQFTTRFQFEAVSTAGGNTSVGNFVDTVSFVLFPYRFELYEGSTVSGNADFINTTGVFGDLDDGDYVLVVFDNLTGCGNVEIPFTIDRSQDEPVIATVVTDDANCDNDEGSVDVTASMPTSEPASYTYEIFDGHSFSSQIGADETIANGAVPFTFTGLAPGDYRIRVTNDDTQCSAFEDIVVDDITVIPAFAAAQTIIDNSSCDPAAPNGFLSVTIQGDVISNYSFTWYDGDDSSDPIIAGPTVGDNDLSDRAAGDYTVVAEHITTGCETVELTLTIADDPYIPNIVITEDAAQTDCGTGNGQLSAYVDNNPDFPPGTNDITGFTFQWQLDGVDLVDGIAAANGSVPSGSQTAVVSGLVADEYTLVVTHTNTDCPATENFILSENQTIPTLSLNGTPTDNTNCMPSAYNGAASVTVSPAGTYDYDWFYSDGTQVVDGAPTAGSNTENLSGVIDDTYKVVATSILGCSSDTLVVVIGAAPPTLGAGESGLTGNSVCDPALNDAANPDANGAVTLTPTGGTGAGTFAFALETSGGTAIANDGSTGGFADVAYNNAAVTTTTVSGLPIGNYVMTITDENSGCTIDHPFAIVDATVDPTLDVATINANTTDNVSCTPGSFTGTATVALADITGQGLALSDYSFFWATAAAPGTQIDDDAVLDDDASGNTGVEDGDYILIVTDLITGCVTATANVTINSGQPTLGAGESGLTGNSVCDPALNDAANPDANGAVTLTPTGGTGAGTFAFALETSGGTAIANDGSTGGFADVAYNNAAVTTTTVSGLPIGNYVMTITDENSGCTIDHPFAIVDATVDPTLDVATINANTTDNTSCIPGSFTGTATVALADITGQGLALSDYSFFWATAAAPGTQIDDDAVLDDDASGNTGVEDGDYILIVTDLITGCVTATANVTINSGQPTLGAGESGLTGNSVCDPALNDAANPDANGAVTLTPTGGTGAGTFAFALETSGGTAIANDGSTGGFADVAYNNAAVTTTTVSGLPIGNYVMTITDENSGCTIDHPFAIVDATVDPTLDVATINANTTDNTSCIPGSFTGTATVALADITGQGLALSDYSFFWATAAAPGTQIDDDAVLDDDASGNTGVEDGDYILIVTDLITGCVTATANVTINSGQPTLGAGESGLTGNSVCDPALNDAANPDANGAVTLTPTGGTGAGTFAFALETSGGTAIANDGSTGGFADVAYNNAAVTTTTVDNTSCIPGSFTGTATVALADITGQGLALSDYSFFWATAAAPGTQIDDDAVLDDDASGNTGVEDGDYILIVTDLITGCVTATANVTINSGQPTLGAGESGLTGNSVCDPALNDAANPDANGAVTLTPTGGTGAGTFAFALETSGGTAIANDGSTGGFADVAYNNAAVTTTTVSGLPIGNYVMTITDENSGCTIDHPFAIVDATVDPTLDVATINANTTDNTSCIPGSFTGTATVALADITGQGLALSDYSFFWATAAAPGTQIDDDAVLDDDASGNTGVEDGDYILIVTDLITGCVTATANVTINSGQPTLGAGESGLTGNSVCDPALNDAANPDANGAVTLTPTGGTGAGTFAFALETSGGTAIANDGSTGGFADVAYNNAAVTTTTVSGLPIGNYVMTITDENSGCTIDHPFAIVDATVDPTLDVATINANTTDNTSCIPGSFTGTATVALADITGQGLALSDYSFFWATAAAPGTQIDDDAVLDDDASGNTGVEDGDYILIVTDLITGCVTATANVTINSGQPTLGAGESGLTGNSVCDPALNDAANPDANGAVTLTPTGGTGAGTFAFALETSGGTAIANDGSTGGFADVAYNNAAVTTTTVSGLPIGNYVMTITDENSGCTIDHPFAIVDATVDPTLDVATINANTTDNVSCTPGSFTGTATVALADITGQGLALSDYSFFWATAAAPGTQIDDDAVLDDDASGNTGVEDGDYILIVTDLITGCVTATANVTINSGQPTLGAGESGLTGNSVCDPALNDAANPDANGAVTLTPTGGTGAGTFAFALETSGGTAIANDGSTGGFADVAYNNAAVTTTTVSGLPIGNYVMTITDENSGCTIDHPFAIVDATVDPTLDVATINANTTDNTSCIPGSFTGTATVALADITGQGLALSDYSFFWATAAAPGTQIDDDAVLDDDASGNTGVEDGDYILIVTDLITGCVTATANVTINSGQPTLGAGESGLTGNSVCDPALNDAANPDANGAVTLTPTGGTGAGTFAFALETSGGTAIANDGSTGGFADVAYNNAAVTTTTVSGLPIGNYVMTITDENSGCTIDHPFAIVDATVDPTLDVATINANTTDNTSCDPNNFTGTATVALADITGQGLALSDYSFFWATAVAPGTQIDDDAVLDDDASGNTGVEDGDYILIVTDLITGCVTATANVTIGINLPTITPTTQVLQDNFSCDVANPIGSATLTVAEGANTNYSFEWYAGIGTAGSPFDTDDQIDNQLHGTYTVLITDNATLCTETAQVVIGEFAPSLTVGSSASGDHSDCYPANGQVSVTPSLTFTPAGPPIGVSSNFTYQWYFGTSATAGNELVEGVDPGNLSTPTNVSTNTVSGLAAGDYTVVITETQTGCVSAIETVTVADEVSPYKPTIEFTANIIPSSCDGENGRITAEITALGAGAPNADGGGLNFTFEWYEGAQDYATLETTGSAAALITGDFLVSNPSPGNSVIVSDNGDTNVGGTTTLDRIISGLYTVVMIDQATGCRYFETFDLGFSGQQVTTTLTIDNVTECPDNGAARVGLADNIILTVAPQSGQFTIGEAFTAAPSGATGIIGADQFTGEVQVTLDDGSAALVNADVLTGATSTETATITAINNLGYATGLNEFDDISQYTIFLYAGNGVPADRFAAYTFEGRVFPYTYNPLTGDRLDGNGTPLASGAGPVLNAGDEAEFPDLPAGDYVAIAQEINNPAFNPGSTSNCWTAASVDEEILDLAYEPILESNIITNNTNCDITAGNGALSLTVIEDPAENLNPALDQQPNGYRFTWVRDADAFTVLTEDILTETATSNPTNLNPGDYTVTVQRLGGAGNTPNSCEVATTLTVGHNPEQHEITNATIAPNQDCNPLDGSIIINDADITDNVADYEFTWYTTYIDPGNAGNVLLADAFVDGGLNNGDQGANSVSGLAAGTYFVEATQVTKTCETPVFEIEVEDETVIPTFTVAQTAQDIVCDDATFTPTGQATLTITNGSAAPADYTISWFEDAGETQPLDGTGAVAAPAFSVNNSVVDQLPAGTYFVRIEDNTTPGDGCISTLQSVTIEQFNTTISVGTTAGVDFNIEPSDDCNPDNGSFEILDITETRPGGATTTISGGDYALTDYTFDWFESDGTTPLADALVVGFNNGDAGANEVAGLAPDTYYVQITNTAAVNGTGCAQAAADFIEFIIEDETVIPTFTVAQTAQDIVCDDATFTPTGQATLTITNGSAAPADYTISWFEDAGETQPLDGTGAVAAPAFSVNNSVVDQLPAGTYFVRIEDNTTPGDGCISTLQSVTIEQFNTTISVGTTAGVDFNIEPSDDCNPDNGSFEILDITETRPGGATTTISGGDYALTDYTFDWFESDGTTPLADALVVGFNNGDAGANEVAGLAPDTYYVQITNTAAVNGTGCAQAAADFIEFIIEDETVIPTFTVAQTAQDIVCDDATFTPTGQATLTITNGSAAPADYTISWFEDAGETQPLDGTGAVAAPAFSVNNSVVDQLPAGTYFVRIEDNTTPGDGCISTLQSVTIEQFNTTISVGTTAGVDFNIEPSDDCNPDNGSFEILDITETRPGGATTTISGGDYALTDYTFDWFESDGTTPLADALVVGFNNGDAGANEVAGLAPDTYYVQITNTAAVNGTGCAQAAADFIEFIIEDETVIPTFTVAQTAQDIVCDDATFTPTGQATLTITNGSAAPADYTISWFEDAGETQPLDGTGAVAAPAFSVNNSVVDQLPAGTYFVRIEDNTTPGDGCISTLQSVTIEQFNTTISVGTTAGVDFNIEPSDDCNPDNGSFEILDITETRPGGATTTISGGDYALTDYTFDWFESDGTTPLADALVVGFNNGDAGANEVAGLAPDTYYVQITNTAAVNGTGCAQAAADFIEFIIEDETVIPTFTVAQTAQDIVCDDATFTPTGQATLTITNGSAAPADYTISWFEDAGETQPLDGTGAVAAPAFSVNNSVVDQLPAGTYFVRIEDNTTPGDGCISTLQSVTIEQFNTTISVGTTAGVDFNIEPSDDCNPDNGSFEILDITETRPGGATTTISGGDYALTDYTFDWFESDGTTPLADALVVGFNNGDAGANEVAGLAPDTYYVQITNTAAVNGTGCAQAAADFIEFIIEDETVIPTFTVAQTAQDIVCDDATFTPTGQATLTITNGSAAPADYTISWFEDAGETQPLDGTGAVAAPAFSVNNSVVDQLPAGTYFVRIEDNTTPGDGCISTLQSVTIEQFNTTISVGTTAGVDFNIEPSDDCNPDNGSFEILDITETRPGGATTTISGGDYALTDYTFDWFESDGTTPLADALVVGFNNGDAGANEVAGLAPDTYYVQITNTAAVNGTGCAQAAADFIEFIIEDETVIPTFTVAQTAQDIVCDDATFTPTGQATLTITNGSAAPADYTISWFEDAGETQPLDGTGAVAAPAFSVNNSVVDQLPAGTYFVRIEDNTTPGDGCISTLQSVTIEQFNTTISVGTTAGVDFNIEPSDDCNPDNGSFEILDITETRPGGATTTISGGDYALTDYTFDWFESDGTTPLADALVVGFNNGDAGANEVAGLAPDTYYVQITNTAAVNGTGCAQAAADFIEFIIEDETVIPTFTVAQTAQDIVCDDATFTPTGQATLTITNGSAAPADYTISWFEDAGETQPLDGTGAVAAPAFSVNNSVVDQLPAGTYFVRIEDNTTPGDGCISTLQSVTIEQFNTTISVGTTAGVDFNIEPSDDCNPDNGSFEILDITETRPGGATTTISGGDYALTDYTFDWFESDGTTPLADALVVGFNNGDAGANEVAGLAPDTYYVQITNTAAVNGTGCAQAAADFIEFIIEDETVNPIINLASAIVQDTYCDNTGNVGDGSVAISITDDGVAATPTDFTITWYRGAIAAGNEIFPADAGSRGSATANGTLTTLSDLAEGDYSVVIVKDLGDTPGTGNEGCTSTAVFNVGSMDDIPTLDDVSIQARTAPDTLCIGNSGTLIINDADVSTGDLTDFEIRITQGSVAGAPLAGSPFTNPAATSISFTNLAADDYFVVAENTTTGCISTTAIINVSDSVRNPQVALIEMIPDEDCGGGVNAGGLEVLVDSQFDHTDHFTFLWEIAGGGAVGVTDNEATLTGVAAGDYQVTVTNTLTSCDIVRTYTITNVPINPSISDFAVVENNICDDDNDGAPADIGSFELLETTFDGNTLDQTAMAGNYQLEVYDNIGDATAGNTGSQVADGDADNTNFIHTELEAGTYFAIVRKIDSDCFSDPLEFEIIDNVLRPIISISLQVADSTCAAGATPNGTLRGTATVGTTSGIDDTDPDYTFQWYLGSGTGTALVDGVDPGNGSTPAGVTTSDISGLAADTYTLEVTRISTGCISLEEFELPNVPTEVSILAIDIVDATNCTPGNGTIAVTSVDRDNVSDYDFDYYDVDPTVGSPAPIFTGNAGAPYVNAAAGVYWVIGTNTIVNCTTLPFEVEVGENLTYPAIDLDDFDFQSNCDPSNPNGRLLVLADGQPENGTYDFEWFFGNDTSDPLTSDDYTGGSNLAGENTNEVSGLAAGFYTVEVTNNTTGCISVETYEMTDDIPNPIAISTSTSANTSCTVPNGKAAVSVITLAPGRAISDYSYYWFTGDLATVGTNPNPANADFTGTLVEGLADGQYVVYVVDDIDNFCQSEAVEVTIEDGTSNPEYTLSSSDVTVCFDVKDGFASVDVPDLSTVNIEWFDASNVRLDTTFFVDELDAGMYRLVLTHVVTGCISEEIFEIQNLAETPSDPFVLVNNGRNNCQFANGSAIANVDGVTNNFLFEWFDPNDMINPYATGSEVFNLDTTTYLVRATNLATGCESAFTSVEIGYEVVDPVYEVVLNNSVCLRTEDGSTNQFTGTAIISFEEFQLATDYVWKDQNGNTVGNDSRLIDAYPGDYTVTFTAENGCEYSASFTIETSITVYNGVSANADGKNDFFLIDCIDYFPNNNVKIFNRAGQPIYETSGYDNVSNRFEGNANSGNTLGSQTLPAGTYFYIIDLGNGSDPIQGFLELVR